ncbi:MAG: hypothetical protein HY675_14775 [Chloroflexi bacterium]|nr:hypothetical protein [Chloroflexota bacterium]
MAPVAVATRTPSPCNPAEPDKLQDITTTQSSPYFVHHPVSALPTVATVVFLPGGSGSRRSAQRAWQNYLANGKGMGSFRIVVPYSVDIDLIDDAPRTFGILREVLTCYGREDAKVHVGGVSNGGRAAFALMLARPQRFATLLGAPGGFSIWDPEAWTKALAGHAVFNGVGAKDDDWLAEVRATHAALVAAGVESVYAEFPGQSHSVDEDFDESVFFEFWANHS